MRVIGYTSLLLLFCEEPGILLEIHQATPILHGNNLSAFVVL